jgi:hypothetical protein
LGLHTLLTHRQIALSLFWLIDTHRRKTTKRVSQSETNISLSLVSKKKKEEKKRTTSVHGGRRCFYRPLDVPAKETPRSLTIQHLTHRPSSFRSATSVAYTMLCGGLISGEMPSLISRTSRWHQAFDHVRESLILPSNHAVRRLYIRRDALSDHRGQYIHVDCAQKRPQSVVERDKNFACQSS